MVLSFDATERVPSVFELCDSKCTALQGAIPDNGFKSIQSTAAPSVAIAQTVVLIDERVSVFMIDKPTRPSSRNKRNPVNETASAQLRRAPNQPRAALTIQIIFEAAAQIMESEGLAGLTTNRIAEQAGYAVGTVYQYFNNKESLLLAMAMHEIEEVAHMTHEIMDVAADRPLDDTLRAIVRAWINAFSGRQRVQYLMMQAVMDHGAFPEFHSNIAEVADDLGKKLSALPLKGVQPLSPSGQFVITRALLGTIRYGFLENSPLLHQTALEGELVNLMRGMLLASPEDSTG